MPVFTANIPGELRVGDRIEIGGKIKKNARKMSVNLCAQEGEEPRDVVLHYDVRFQRDNIISLSRKNGLWIGSGNYDTNYNMFVPDTMFSIIFEIKDTDVITIYCQGKFHSNFLPKIPLSMAKYIVAWADIQRITHCYFYLGSKMPGDNPPPLPSHPSPVMTGAEKRSARVRKHPVQDCPQLRSSDSSISSSKTRQKAEGHADKFFYETLMCQQSRVVVQTMSSGSTLPHSETNKFNPTETRFRSAGHERTRPECSRKYNEAEHESDYSEDVTSKNEESLVDETEVLSGKKQMRRGKFPFSQFVNLMGKTNRRN